MGKSNAQKLAEAEGITLEEAKQRLADEKAQAAEEPATEEAPAEPAEVAPEPEADPQAPALPPLAVNPVDEADMAREAQKRELRTPGIPKNVAKQIREWLGDSRGVADTSPWDGKSITVVSFPDYQKQTFYRQASSE